MSASMSGYMMPFRTPEWLSEELLLILLRVSDDEASRCSGFEVWRFGAVKTGSLPARS